MEENSANNSIKKVCRTCVAIRLFIVALLFLVIISILAKEHLHYLSFITPGKVAAGIIIFGSLSFLVKFILWKIDKKNNINDLSPND